LLNHLNSFQSAGLVARQRFAGDNRFGAQLFGEKDGEGRQKELMSLLHETAPWLVGTIQGSEVPGGRHACPAPLYDNAHFWQRSKIAASDV
jgi:hypothetical protein